MDYCVQSTLRNRLIDNRELLIPKNTRDGHVTIEFDVSRGHFFLTAWADQSLRRPSVTSNTR